MADYVTSLASALGQVALVIILGYCSVFFHCIDKTNIKNLGTFVGTICLSALFCKEIADLKLTDWSLLIPVMAGKFIVFFLCCPVAYFFKSGDENLFARWGMLALSTTMGHDLTIGLALVMSLWSDPKYVSMLYIYSTIQVILLKSLCLILIEYGKCCNGGSIMQSLKKVMKKLAVNPLVDSMLLGILLNFIFGQKLPTFLNELLEMIAAAFTPGALFLLGVFTYGKLSLLKGKHILQPGILVFIKQLFLPIVIRYLSIAQGLDEEMVNFNFLYGSMPIAATVPVISQQYSVMETLMSTSSIFSLVIGAPLLFITSVLFMTQNGNGLSNAIYILQTVSNSFSLVGTVLLAIGFIGIPRWRKYPMNVVFWLLVSQTLFIISQMMCESHHNTFFDFSFLMRHQAQYWQMMLGLNLVIMTYRDIREPHKLVRLYIALGLISMGVNIGIRETFGRTEEVLQEFADPRPTCWAVYKSEAYTDVFYGSIYLIIDIFVIFYLFANREKARSLARVYGYRSLAENSSFEESEQCEKQNIADTGTGAVMDFKVEDFGEQSVHGPLSRGASIGSVNQISPVKKSYGCRDAMCDFLNMDYYFRCQSLVMLQIIRLILQIPLLISMVTEHKFDGSLASLLFISIIFVDAQVFHTSIAFCTTRDYKKYIDQHVNRIVCLFWEQSETPQGVLNL